MPPAFNVAVRDEVRRLHSRGLNDVQIAKRLGISQTWAYKIRSQLGLRSTFQPRTKLDAAKARRLHDRGLADAAIAKKVRMSREAVQKWRQQVGLPSNDPRQRGRRSTRPR